MNRIAYCLAVLLLFVSAAFAQMQKAEDSFPRTILHARYVYVTAMSGDAYDARRPVTPGDRDAVFRVENAIRQWRRYALTTRPENADLILAVRRGNVASARPGVRIGTGSDGPFIGPDIGVEAGTPDDALLVLDGHVSDPTRAPALWRRTQPHGLDPPALPLFQQFKKEAEQAAARHP